MANLLFPHFLNLHRTLARAKSKELSVQIYMDFAAAAWGKCFDLGACIGTDNIMTTINDTHCDHHLLHTIQEPDRLNVFFCGWFLVQVLLPRTGGTENQPNK